MERIIEISFHRSSPFFVLWGGGFALHCRCPIFLGGKMKKSCIFCEYRHGCLEDNLKTCKNFTIGKCYTCEKYINKIPCKNIGSFFPSGENCTEYKKEKY